MCTGHRHPVAACVLGSIECRVRAGQQSNCRLAGLTCRHADRDTQQSVIVRDTVNAETAKRKRSAQAPTSSALTLGEDDEQLPPCRATLGCSRLCTQRDRASRAAGQRRPSVDEARQPRRTRQQGAATVECRGMSVSVRGHRANRWAVPAPLRETAGDYRRLSTFSSAETSSGFTRWWWKPASKVRRRSSICPQPVSAASTVDSMPGC